MKVGYVAPMSITAVNGGVRTQALSTAKHCKELGIEPVLVSPWDDLKQQKPDLIHVFGSSIENSGIIPQIKELGIPLVLSPIFFSTRSAAVIKRALKFEKVSAVIGSGIRSDFGIKAELCKQADLVLPNTQAEATLVEQGFSVSHNNIQVVPNGVEQRFSNAKPDLFAEKYGLQDFVLFVGQASAPRKNVQNLLCIASNIEEPIVIIGSFGDDNYSRDCLKLAENAKNVTLIPTLEHESELLASAYAACKVFVLPSLYETPGIAAMEAALAGAEIVITQYGGTKDHFADYAEYIQPKSEGSLLAGIQKALRKQPDKMLKNRILTHFTWQKVAELTVEQYKKLIA